MKKSAIDIVKEVKKELSEFRAPFEKVWKLYDDAYYGKQHKTGEDVKTVKNIIFKVIEGEVPILTDSMPGTSVIANLEDRQIDADILGKAVNYVYQDQNLPLILPTVVRSMLTSAPGYLYPYWNQDADGGEGKVEYKKLPWESVYLDGASTIEQSERALIEIPMRRSAIIRAWPEFKEQLEELKGTANTIAEDAAFESRDVEGKKTEMGKPKQYSAKDILKFCETWIKTYDLQEIAPEKTEAELAKEKEQLLKGEAPDVGKWENHAKHEQAHLATRAEVLAQLQLPPDAPIELVGQAVEQILQQNPEAEALLQIPLIVTVIDNHLSEHADLKKLNPESKEPKYGDGWRVVKSVGDIVVYDGPNPEYIEKRDGHIPIVPFYAYKDDSIYGFGEVKNILDIQQTLNDADWRQLEGLRVSSNTGWITDHEADVAEKSLTNKPGIVIKKKKGTEVRRLEAGIVSPQLQERKLSDKMTIEEVSGINEASQGNLPSSASGIAIRQLQNQSIGRIRLKDRYLQHYSMRRLALLTSVLIVNHWTVEKQLRLRSDNTNVEQFVFDPIKVQDLEYTIDIASGSMAGIDKDSLNALYLNFLNGGHITFEDFLLVSDFPKKEILLSRLSERNQQAQEMEQIKQTIKQLNQENILLRGAKSPEMLNHEEKKVFDEAKRMAIKERMMMEAQEQMQMQPMQMAASSGVPMQQMQGVQG